MKRTRIDPRLQKTAVALALAAAFGLARAEDDVAQLTQLPSFVSVGAGAVSGDSKDRSLFAQYNGLRKDDAYLLLDFLYNNRDANGLWTSVEGRNLGLDTRELRARVDRQGDWKIFGEYWQLTRYYPRTINTAEQNAGSPTPVVSLLSKPGTGSDLDLKQERKRATVGGEKWLTRNLMFEATFTNEDKDGARIFGRGFTCPSGAAPTPICPALATGTNQWAILMLPDPQHYKMRQIDARLNLIGANFLVTAGYYGSFFTNENGTLVPTVNGNLNDPLGNPLGNATGTVALTTGLRSILQAPMALPPDNQAHQLYVSGNYSFTNTTRATFKYAYTHATQHENFLSQGLTGAPGGRSDLGGVLDTNLVQAGLTSRPIPRLNFLANVRYEDRDDKTPIAAYNLEGTNTFTNGHISYKKLTGKLEGTYALEPNTRATLGVDYDSIDRGEFVSTDQVAGLSALRRKVHETGVRAELRHTMSDSLSGYLSVVHSEREGSSWLKPNSGALTGVFPASADCVSSGANACIFNRTGIFPYMLENRRRDKVRVLADWSPADRFSVQLSGDYGRDNYSGPTEKGLDHTGMYLLGIDASYVVSDALKLTAYYSYSEQTLKVSHSTGYIADLADQNSTLGVGALWKATPRLNLGADLLYINDRNVYQQGIDTAGSATNAAFLASSGGLPDVVFRDLRLKLNAVYAIQRNADVRVDVIHDRSKLNEWTWATFVYSDNTTVTLKPVQNVTFVGVSYIYRFR